MPIPKTPTNNLGSSCLTYVLALCVLCWLLYAFILQLPRYADLNISYSPHARSGHGQAHLTFEDSVRGYYMCWYTRDILQTWTRDMVDADMAAAGHAHAPDPRRERYYYQVCFLDQYCQKGGTAHDGFGQPVVHGDRFPGWALAHATCDEMLQQNAALRRPPRNFDLLGAARS